MTVTFIRTQATSKKKKEKVRTADSMRQGQGVVVKNENGQLLDRYVAKKRLERKRKYSHT